MPAAPRRPRRVPRCSPRPGSAHRADHFWARYVLGPVPPGHATPCLVWTGAVKSDGYGSVKFGRGYLGAHQVAYLLGHGRPLAPWAVVSHSCDNPLCGEPLHLSAGTHAANMADMRAKGRHRNGATAEAAGHAREDVHPQRCRRERRKARVARWVATKLARVS